MKCNQSSELLCTPRRDGGVVFETHDTRNIPAYCANVFIYMAPLEPLLFLFIEVSSTWGVFKPHIFSAFQSLPLQNVVVHKLVLLSRVVYSVVGISALHDTWHHSRSMATKFWTYIDDFFPLDIHQYDENMCAVWKLSVSWAGSRICEARFLSQIFVENSGKYGRILSIFSGRIGYMTGRKCA